jgi:hypothetical protein
MKRLFVLILATILAFSATACTQPDQSIAVLEREGYSNIEITGYDPFGCSEDDHYRTGFRAEKNGQQVKGVVCSGLMFKGTTIRTY